MDANPPPDATLLAVADVLADERHARIVVERELAADLSRLRERVDDYGNVIKNEIAAAVRALDVKDGKDGKDGASGERGADAYPGQARGLHDPAASYRAMDVTVMNGCEWRALRDDPGPLPGDGWVQGAKQGRRGDRGERGAQGLPGKDGTGIEDVIIDRGVLVFLLTDGRRREFAIEAAA